MNHLLFAWSVVQLFSYLKTNDFIRYIEFFFVRPSRRQSGIRGKEWQKNSLITSLSIFINSLGTMRSIHQLNANSQHAPTHWFAEEKMATRKNTEKITSWEDAAKIKVIADRNRYVTCSRQQRFTLSPTRSQGKNQKKKNLSIRFQFVASVWVFFSCAHANSSVPHSISFVNLFFSQPAIVAPSSAPGIYVQAINIIVYASNVCDKMQFYVCTVRLHSPRGNVCLRNVNCIPSAWANKYLLLHNLFIAT